MMDIGKDRTTLLWIGVLSLVGALYGVLGFHSALFLDTFSGPEQGGMLSFLLAVVFGFACFRLRQMNDSGYYAGAVDARIVLAFKAALFITIWQLLLVFFDFTVLLVVNQAILSSFIKTCAYITLAVATIQANRVLK